MNGRRESKNLQIYLPAQACDVVAVSLRREKKAFRTSVVQQLQQEMRQKKIFRALPTLPPARA